MNRILYLLAMALLGLGLTLAQNTTPASDQSNSSHNHPQSQSTTTLPSTGAQVPDSPSTTMPGKAEREHKGVPNATVEDKQSCTTSTTGVGGQTPGTPSSSTMGTTSNSNAPQGEPVPDKGLERKQQQQTPAAEPPADQQPNPSTAPDKPQAHLVLEQTPAARAMSTHTPDPGTCMNPAAMQTTQAADGTTTPARTPNCE